MTGHVPPPPTGTCALVATFHSLLDWGRYIVALVDLDPTDVTALVILDHPNHRRAARRWHPGDRLIIHGTTTTQPPTDDDQPFAILVRAHEVHKIRPDNIRAIGPQLLDRRRHTPPHILRRIEQQTTDEENSP